MPYLEEARIFPPLKKLVLWAAKIIEKAIGTKLLMALPYPSTHFSYARMRLLNVCSALQDMGIIKELRMKPPEPDEPFIYSYTTNPEGHGAHFFSEEHALWTAVADGVERSLWKSSDNFRGKGISIAPYKEVRKQALSIFSLAGFSDEQKKENETIRFDEHTTFTWVPGHFVTSGKKILCPLQLVSAGYFRARGKEPMLRWGVTTGLATGSTIHEAIAKGVLEVIERDAFMITYLNRLSPPVIDLDYLAQQDNDIAKVVEQFKRNNLELHIIELPTDFDVSVPLAAVIDRTGLGPALTLGASANSDYKDALLAAASESLSVRNFAKSRFTRPFDTKHIGHIERILYWSQLEHLPKLDFLFAGEKMQRELSQQFHRKFDKQVYQSHSYRKLYNQLCSELRKKSYEALYVELSPKEIRQLGLRTVFVVIPELQPLHLEEEIPYFGGSRIKEVPEKLGYKPAKKLNTIPHPFP